VSTLSLQAPATTDQFVTVFAALSEPIRVRMLQMMIQQGEDDLPCTALDEELPIAKSTISYHVQILRRAGLIGVRKAGRNYFYQLRLETSETFAPGFLDHLAETEEPVLAA
jgi:ArsR family transcriptional regulator, arsenate/arsenite/antimonite-responsive transcriptional repressor